MSLRRAHSDGPCRKQKLTNSERELAEAEMKIAAVTVDLLSVPLDRPYRAGGREISANWHVLAQVTTTDGVQGFGYVVALQQTFVKAVAAATSELGAHLIGMHVMEVEAAWDRMARAGDWIGPGGLLHYAIAPLDIALWDAAGKTLGQPLHRMLGRLPRPPACVCQ